MEDLRKHRKHFSRIGFCLLASALIIEGLRYAVAGIATLFNWTAVNNPDINLLLSTVIVYFIGMPAAVLMLMGLPAYTPMEMAQMQGSRMSAPIKLSAGVFFLHMIITYTLGYTSNFFGVIVSIIIGLIKGDSSLDSSTLDALTDSSMWVIVLAAVIMAPILEEYVFRKILIDRTIKYGQGVSVVVSGLMFGLFHGNFNQFVYATVVGMFFAYVYVKTGNVKYTMGLHMAMNFMGGVVATGIVKKMLDNPLLESLYEMTDPEAVMELIATAEGGADIIRMSILLMMFFAIVAAIVFCGWVLLIAFARNIRFEAGIVTIPKGQRFKTVILNPGMLLYFTYWIITIVVLILE